MSIPYIPLFVADYEADTAHLTLEEDGAYNRLLRLCWRTPGCSIPDDANWIMRRMRCSADEYHRVVAPILDEFFCREKARLFSPRLTAEKARIEETSRKRSVAGSKGGRPAKPLKTNKTEQSPAKANGKHLEPEPELEPDREKRTPNGVPKKSRGTRLPEGWALPREWGEWAVSQGWPEPLVRAEAEKFRDYWIAAPGQKGVKLDWLATWRNWLRNSNTPKVINGGRNDRSRFDAAHREYARRLASGEIDPGPDPSDPFSG